MSDWVFGGTTIPAADAPWYESAMPEDQEDEYVLATPIGATEAASTLAQRVSRPSRQATLIGECSAATRTAILALRNTNLTIKTPFDTTGKSWLLMKARFDRWNNSNHQHAIAGASERFLYHLELLGRS